MLHSDLHKRIGLVKFDINQHARPDYSAINLAYNMAVLNSIQDI